MPVDVLAFENNLRQLSVRPAARWRAERGFAATAFADQPNVSPRDCKAHAIDRHEAFAGGCLGENSRAAAIVLGQFPDIEKSWNGSSVCVATCYKCFTAMSLRFRGLPECNAPLAHFPHHATRAQSGGIPGGARAARFERTTRRQLGKLRYGTRNWRQFTALQRRRSGQQPLGIWMARIAQHI